MPMSSHGDVQRSFRTCFAKISMLRLNIGSGMLRLSIGSCMLRLGLRLSIGSCMLRLGLKLKLRLRLSFRGSGGQVLDPNHLD